MREKQPFLRCLPLSLALSLARFPIFVPVVFFLIWSLTGALPVYRQNWRFRRFRPAYEVTLYPRTNVFKTVQNGPKRSKTVHVFGRQPGPTDVIVVHRRDSLFKHDTIFF